MRQWATADYVPAAAPGSALSELKIMAVARVIRIAKNVEEPRAGRNQQPAAAVLGGAAECLSPGRPAVWRRHGDPALRLIWFRHVLENLGVPGYTAEDIPAGSNFVEHPGRDGVSEDPEAAVAQLLDRVKRAGNSWAFRRWQGRDQERPEGESGKCGCQRERIELGLSREVNPQRVCACGFEGRPIGQPLAKVVRLPGEHDTDLDRLRTLWMRHAARVRLIRLIHPSTRTCADRADAPPPSLPPRGAGPAWRPW